MSDGAARKADEAAASEPKRRSVTIAESSEQVSFEASGGAGASPSESTPLRRGSAASPELGSDEADEEVDPWTSADLADDDDDDGGGGPATGTNSERASEGSVLMRLLKGSNNLLLAAAASSSSAGTGRASGGGGDEDSDEDSASSEEEDAAAGNGEEPPKSPNTRRQSLLFEKFSRSATLAGETTEAEAMKRAALEMVRAALRRPSAERTPDDIEELFVHIVSNTQDPFLKGLDPSVQRAICSRLALEEYAPGRQIMEFGDVGDKLYIVLNGRVRVDIPQGRTGGGVHLGEFTHIANKDPGGVFGERALLVEGCKRNARVTAAEECTLASLKREDYMWCLSQGDGNDLDKDKIAFLQAVDRANFGSLEDGDIHGFAGLLKEKSYHGSATILRQGDEVDQIVFVKSGFCSVVRELHPRHHDAFNHFADKKHRPANPFADEDLPPESPAGRSGDPGLEASRAFTSTRVFTSTCSSVKSPTAASSKSKSVASAAAAAEAAAAAAAASTEASLGLELRAARAKMMPEFAEVFASDNSFATRERRATRVGTRSFKRGGGPSSPSGASATSGADAGAGGMRSPLAFRQKSFELADEGLEISGLSSPDVLIVDHLQSGRSFGTAEMFEGTPYQFSLVADPWAVVYVVSKYDLLRNTPKTILHRMFVDHKMRLSDDRLIQRMKQKQRWNNYKNDLLDDIQQRRNRSRFTVIDRRAPPPRRAGIGELSSEDYCRIGAGEGLWHGRAATPPAPSYNSKDTYDVLHISCIQNQEGKKDLKVTREHRDASLVALDERILMMTSTARTRDKLRQAKRQSGLPAVGGSSASSEATLAASGPGRGGTAGRPPALDMESASCCSSSVASTTPHGGAGAGAGGALGSSPKTRPFARSGMQVLSARTSRRTPGAAGAAPSPSGAGGKAAARLAGR